MTYMFERYYEPTSGTFISSSPLATHIEHSFSVFFNEPTKYVDPHGLWSVEISGGMGWGGALSFGQCNGNTFINPRFGFAAGVTASFSFFSCPSVVSQCANSKGGGVNLDINASGAIVFGGVAGVDMGFGLCDTPCGNWGPGAPAGGGGYLDLIIGLGLDASATVGPVFWW